MSNNKHSTNDEQYSQYHLSGSNQIDKKCKKTGKKSKKENYNLESGQKKKEKNQKSSYTIWKRFEQILFLKWLKNYAQNFKSETQKRRTKAFVKIADKMKGRTALQCKSHYQKIQKSTKNGTVEQIIEWIQKELSKPQLEPQKKSIGRLLTDFELNRTKQIEIQTLVVKNQGVFVCFALPLCNLSIW